MDDVLQRIEQKIDAMGGRFDKVDERFDQVDERFDKVDERFDKVEGRLGAVEGGLAAVQGDLSSVKVDLREVTAGLSRLTETVHQQGLRQEYLIDKVTLTMEGVLGGRQVMDARFAEVMAKLDERVRPIELATRFLATKKPKARG